MSFLTRDGVSTRMLLRNAHMMSELSHELVDKVCSQTNLFVVCPRLLEFGKDVIVSCDVAIGITINKPSSDMELGNHFLASWQDNKCVGLSWISQNAQSQSEAAIRTADRALQYCPCMYFRDAMREAGHLEAQRHRTPLLQPNRAPSTSRSP